MFKIFNRTKEEKEITQEVPAEEVEEIEYVKALKEKFEFDASHIKYRVRDSKYLDILLFDDKNKPYSKTAVLSKNRKMIVSNNGAISLSNSFIVGHVRNSPASEIHISSEGYNVLICSYDFNDRFYVNHKKEIKELYSKVIEVLTKIFHDATDNFDYPEVRATKDEEEILDKLIKEEK